MAGDGKPGQRNGVQPATDDHGVPRGTHVDESGLPRAGDATSVDGAEDGGHDAQPVLGAGLRALRLSRGHTLAAVSRATGISASFLSVVENGHSDITIGRLMRLLDFYEARIDDLLPSDPERDRIVVRRGEEIELVSPPRVRTGGCSLPTRIDR